MVLTRQSVLFSLQGVISSAEKRKQLSVNGENPLFSKALFQFAYKEECPFSVHVFQASRHEFLFASFQVRWIESRPGLCFYSAVYEDCGFLGLGSACTVCMGDPLWTVQNSRQDCLSFLDFAIFGTVNREPFFAFIVASFWKRFQFWEQLCENNAKESFVFHASVRSI